MVQSWRLGGFETDISRRTSTWSRLFCGRALCLTRSRFVCVTMSMPVVCLRMHVSLALMDPGPSCNLLFDSLLKLASSTGFEPVLAP